MNAVEQTRRMDAEERAYLRKIVAETDRAQAKADDVRDRRDALLRTLRWGSAHRAPVSPAELIAATVTPEHPNGLSPTTFYRAVGRTKDRPAVTKGSEQDGTTSG